jgi:hypothetical protein
VQRLWETMVGAVDRCSPQVAVALWRRVLLAALLSAAVALLGGAPASATAAIPGYGYDAAAYAYDGHALLSSPDTVARDARGSTSGPAAVSWVSLASVARFGVAAETAGGASEVFYRGMSNAEAGGLARSGGLSVRGESSVTQDLGYFILAEGDPRGGTLISISPEVEWFPQVL